MRALILLFLLVAPASAERHVREATLTTNSGLYISSGTVPYVTVGGSLTVNGLAGILTKSSVTASAFFGDGSHLGGVVSLSAPNIFTAANTFTSTMTVNGLTDFGAMTDSEIAALACPSLPCRVMSITNGWIYYAYALTAGAWRTPMGIGP